MTLPPSLNMSAPPKRQGLAVTSFVLGLLAVMCFGLLAGIPAIILGHLAHRRARKVPEQYAGGGLAIAGFALGYASLLTTFVLAGLALPLLAKTKAGAQSVACVNNMKQIGLAFRIWASDHQDRFPFERLENDPQDAQAATAAQPEPVAIFQALSTYLGSPKILVCPGDSFKRPAPSFQTLSTANISYELEAGPDVRATTPDALLAWCPVHGTELFADGSVHRNRR